MSANCFPKSDLEQYLQGRVDDELSDAIEVHLAECDRCEDTVAGLGSAEDTLIRTLKVKASESNRHGSELAWIEKLAEMPGVLDQQPRTRPNPSDDSLAKAAPRELGDYELLSVLGRGGMSVVFSARHKHLGREVAIKLLLPTNQQTVSRERFTREMRAVGALDHPAIVRATDAGESGDTLYLVMDRVDGVDLNRVAKQHGPMSIDEACAIVRDVASGLAYAHERQIVHRDVKPSNIMLTRDGRAKILDFGLARIQSSTGDVSLHTTMGQLLGTLDYMAPEQAGGQTVDHRADVYGLGATLFKLLTGRPPHGRSSEVPIVEFLSRLASKKADRLDDHRSDIPNELTELVADMLLGEANERVTDMNEVIARLAPLAKETNLSKLAEKAIEDIGEERPQDLTTLHDSLASILPTDTTTGHHSQPNPAPTTSSANMNRRNWFPWAIALATFGGIVALVIAMSIKSPEGEIHITSELNDVKVDIVNEENRVDTIMVDEGEESTTVRTGRYRIRVASPLDNVKVTPQSVVVSKGKVFEVAITKRNPAPSSEATLGANQPSEQRDPIVALNAKIELEETIKALEVAKKKPEDNRQRISELEAKLLSLRSLSLPIPTQPVYKGRTLEDWTAQMRFETDLEARGAAADAVYELAHTIPLASRIRTLLQVDAVTSSGRLERFLYEINGTPPVTKTFRGIREAEQLEVVATQLAAALNDDDEEIQSLALLVCLELRQKMQASPDGWKVAVDALRTHANAPIEKTFDSNFADSSSSVRKIVYASCLRDKELATRVARQIDSRKISNSEAFLLVVASTEQGFGSRDDQFRWFGHYLSKVRRERGGRDRWRGYAYMGRLRFSPFQEIAKTKKIEPNQQADFDKVIAVILDSLDEDQSQTFDAGDQEMPADPIGTLCYIVSIAPPDGDLKRRVVEVLNNRLADTLDKRKTIDFATAERWCTPSEIAGALTMLTGEVPDALIHPVEHEESEVFRHLLQLKSILEKAYDQRRAAIDFRGDSDWHFLLACDWFPRESVQILTDAGQGAVLSNYSGGSKVTEFDPRLAVGFASFVDGLKSSWLAEDGVEWFQERHPRFSQLVEKSMRECQSYSAGQKLFSIWKKTKSDEQTQNQLAKWLDNGDGVRSKIAVNHFLTPVRPGIATVPKKLQPLVAKAYKRMGEMNVLTATDFRTIYALGSKLPDASKLAGDFLLRRLTNPKPHQVPSLSSVVRRSFPGRGVLDYALRVFKRNPAPKQVEELLRLIDKGDFASSSERGDLQLYAQTVRGEESDPVPPAPDPGDARNRRSRSGAGR